MTIFSLIFTSMLLYHVADATLNTDIKIDEILSFLTLNGKRHLSMITLDHYDINVVEFQYKFLEISKRHGNIYSNNVSPKFDFLASDEKEELSTTTVKGKIDYYTDSLLIIASSQDTSNWDAYLELLTNVEVMSATMIFPDQIPPDKTTIEQACFLPISELQWLRPWVRRLLLLSPSSEVKMWPSLLKPCLPTPN